MKRRIPFFVKTIALVWGTLIALSLSIVLVYHIIAPRILAKSKIDDLTTKGNIITDYIESVLRGEVSSSYLLPLIGRNTSQWECSVWVVDVQGNTLLRTQQSDGRRLGRLPESLYSQMLPTVLTGETATRIGKSKQLLSETDTEHSSDSTPLYNELNLSEEADDASTEEQFNKNVVAVALPIFFYREVVGAVFMVQSVDSVMSSFAAMTNAIKFSLLAILLLMMPILLFFSLKVSVPIQIMRAAALRMASGDFSVRASETNRDEIGELGYALNHLASELGSTISSLQLERNRLQNTIDGLSEGILSVDTDGSVLLTNPVFFTLLQADRGIQSIDELPEEIAQLCRRTLASGETATETFWHDAVAIRVSFSPLHAEDGSLRGCVGIFSDVTREERLEQTRRDYVANVSHELRTPLTAMRGLLEPLCDGLIKTEDQRQQTYNVILRETMRLSRLVNDMLELSRLQSGQASMHRSRFSPNALLNQVYATYAAYAEDYQHTFTFSVPDDLPDVVGNPDRTHQVLVALLDNAFKYTPEGGSITLRAEVKDDLISVSVSDTGPGISRDDLPHVFDRFYQVDKSHHGKGTGLGLAIAYEIMKALGETLSVESVFGEGSTFAFTLHIAKPEPEMLPETTN